MRAWVIGVAVALAAPTTAGAQAQAQSDSVVRVIVNAAKPEAIERTMRAFIEAGLTVTDVDRAGLVKAVGREKGDVTVTYTAAVLPNGATSDIILSAFARYQPYAAPVNPLGAQVTPKTKGGAGVWARLLSMAKSLKAQPAARTP